MASSLDAWNADHDRGCVIHVVGVDDVSKDWFVVSLMRGQHCWSIITITIP